MERRLKERLVGAALLVTVIVLVVPELLSGPKQTVTAVAPLSLPTASPSTESMRSEPTRTVTVDLDTQKTMPLEAPPQAAVATSAPPQSVTAAPEAAAPLVQAAPIQAAPIQAPPLRAAPALAVPLQAAPAAPTTIENQAASPRVWALQLGSFASHANAEQLVRAVKAHNSPAYLSTSGAGKSLRYRVRVGPLADRAAAERMLAKLKSEGRAASLVAP